MAQLRADGVRVSVLAQGHPLVRVDGVPKGARLAALAPVAPQIAWLNLADFDVADGELRVLADMPHLTRLELQRPPSGTAISPTSPRSRTSLS